METKRQSDKTALQSLTQEQPKAATEAERLALQTWATQNGINLQYLRFKGFGGRGYGMMGEPGSSPASSATTTQ